MTTVLFSTVGEFKATVISKPCRSDDGFVFKVMETKKTFKSEKGAIKNARVFLKKKRASYTPKIKRRRLVPIKTKRRRLG